MKKVLFGLVFCVSLVFCCFGLFKTTLAWTDITGSLSGYEVGDLIQASDGSIYAGGQYSDVGPARVWKYTGGVWTDATGNLNGSNISSLMQASDGSIYAAGVDNSSDVVIWNYVNGSWNDVTYGLDAYEVNAIMQVSDGTIYVGGNVNLGGTAKVWRYSGNSWIDISDSNLAGDNVNVLMQALDGSIYAGGSYYNVVAAKFESKIWHYVENSWSNVTGNLDGSFVYSLTQMADGVIYLGGSDFDLISGIQTARVWKGGNNSWQNMFLPVTGDNSAINKVLVFSNLVYASGYDDVTGTHTAKVWTYFNNVWSSEVLGEEANHVAAWMIMQGSDGFYAGGFVGALAKVWRRDFTAEEKRIIEENNLVNGDPVDLISDLNGQTISGQELDIYFKNLPNKLTENGAYWMQWQLFDKYPKKWKLKKKTALKRYWSLTTNLNSYKGKAFKIKVTFKYTQNLYKKLHKKNKKIKEKNLKLFTYEKKKWKIIRAKMNRKKKTMSYVFKKFKKKTNLYAIGASL